MKPKYRLLTQTELQQFKKEFVDFLVINGITATDWESILKHDKDKAGDIIRLFSDVVFEKLMRQTKHIFTIKGKVIFSFQFDVEDARLIIAEYNGEADLRNYQGRALPEFIKQNRERFVLSEQVRSFEDTREQELFALMQTGCLYDDADLFITLSQL